MIGQPSNRDGDTLPVAHFVHADRIRADIGDSEWRLDTRRHQGRSVLLVLSAGGGFSRLSQGQVAFRGPCLLWLPPGAGQFMRVTAGSEGYMLSLSEDLVARAATGGASSALRSVADRVIHGEGTAMDGRIPALLQAAEAIRSELREPGEGTLALIIAHVTAILVHAWRAGGFYLKDIETNRSGSAIFQRFLHAVELHFREGWPISRYAAQLGVTERRLHAAVAKAASRSPLQLLHARILEAARSRLEQSSLPVAQIGYGLGFSDPAGFSRFFKKATGLSPGAFRRRCLQERRDDITFAAWP